MSLVYQHPLNRGRFETWNTRPEVTFHQVIQVHGADIVSVETLPCEADGIVVSWEDLDSALGIKTADCLPVVIEGEKGVVFLHAGWKGLALHILKRPEIHMIHPVRALIGPCIHECCFEVTPDFKNNFPKSSHFKNHEGKLHFDLTLEAQDQLREEFPHLQIEVAPECTMCNTNFHSHRRDKTTQRNWNIYIKG